MVTTERECRVDLASLRVERGSSEDVVVPRQVVAVVFTKEAGQGEGYQDVEGKEVIKSQQISGLMLGIDSEPSLT